MSLKLALHYLKAAIGSQAKTCRCQKMSLLCCFLCNDNKESPSPSLMFPWTFWCLSPPCGRFWDSTYSWDWWGFDDPRHKHVYWVWVQSLNVSHIWVTAKYRHGPEWCLNNHWPCSISFYLPDHSQSWNWLVSGMSSNQIFSGLCPGWCKNPRWTTNSCVCWLSSRLSASSVPLLMNSTKYQEESTNTSWLPWKMKVVTSQNETKSERVHGNDTWWRSHEEM